MVIEYLASYREARTSMNKQMLEEYFLELDEALSVAFPNSESMSVIKTLDTIFGNNG